MYPTPFQQWTRPFSAPAGRNEYHQQGCHAAAIRAVATITVVTCSFGGHSARDIVSQRGALELPSLEVASTVF